MVLKRLPRDRNGGTLDHHDRLLHLAQVEEAGRSTQHTRHIRVVESRLECRRLNVDAIQNGDLFGLGAVFDFGFDGLGDGARLLGIIVVGG
jgi:hypothetical protein